MKINRGESLNFYLQLSLSALAVFAGTVQTWATRHSINADGISYLDIADAYFRGDWKNAVNAMWSPLYSFFLGTAMFLAKTSPEWEYPLAHFVNFIIYLIALVSFNFYLNEVQRERQTMRARSESKSLNFPNWLFLIVAYFVFLWATLVLIKIKHLTPDMCVAAIVFVAAGLLLRIREHAKIRYFAYLGIALGIGYLAKAPMLPLAIVFLGCAWRLAANTPNQLFKILAAGVCLVLVASPFIATLSLTKHKLTFGESGKINYAWHVNEVARGHWQGENPDEGVPLHPTRKILEKPAVYEFGTPLEATYPVWYDPTYWYDGLTFQFDPAKQFRALAGGIIYYLSIFDFYGLILAAVLLLLLSLTADRKKFLTSISAQWYLIFPSFAALLMYSLVHVETRYIAPFIALIIISLVSCIDLSTKKKGNLNTAVLLASLIFSIAPATGAMFYANLNDSLFESAVSNNQWLSAAKAHQAGIREGDKIASIGRANLNTAQWARLARVRIVAEIYSPVEVECFWQADSQVKQEVAAAFVRSGAKFMVATNAPVSAESEGWLRLSGTNVFIYRLPES